MCQQKWKDYTFHIFDCKIESEMNTHDLDYGATYSKTILFKLQCSNFDQNTVPCHKQDLHNFVWLK